MVMAGMGAGARGATPATCHMGPDPPVYLRAVGSLGLSGMGRVSPPILAKRARESCCPSCTEQDAVTLDRLWAGEARLPSVLEMAGRLSAGPTEGREA